MSKPTHYVHPFKRRPASRPVRESFLILCEGKNTEPVYFNAFRLSTATVRALPVTSGDAMAVVKSAIERRDHLTRQGKEFDHYWVVFDKDATAHEAFNQAISLAQGNGFQTAYSNQAFELWFLLHYHYISGPLHRNEYASRLTKLLGFPYTKHQSTVLLLFKALFDRQETAIQNAQRLYDQYQKPRNPSHEESSTTVHILVGKLREFL